MGFTVTEACDRIGISRSMFYAIRDGRQPASDKLRSRLDIAMSEEPQSQRLLSYEAIPETPQIKVREKGPTLSKAEVKVLIGEIKVRLDLLQSSFEGMLD